MFLSTSLLWRGLLAIGIGIMSVAWPNITLGAFVILFAVFAFMTAFGDAARAFASDRAGPVAGWLLLALVSLAAGIAALAWPGITAVVLAVWVGIWALVTGFGEVAMAFAPARRQDSARCGRWADWSPSPWRWCCSCSRTSERCPSRSSSACSASSTA